MLRRRSSVKRAGFFAGSFDPIHDGHLDVAKSAVKELDLDDLYFLVEEQPWGNKKPIDVKHRREMIEIAVSNDPRLSQLELQDKQFNIKNTLPELENMFKGSEVYFVFGADVFMQMNSAQWPQLDELLKHYIVVFERKNITEKEISLHAKDLGIVVAIIKSRHMEHSSTDIRLKPHQKTIWLPTRVADYIDKNNLYAVSDSASVK
jgi:nicotinate-nucleotide adenylyltransferase